MHFIGDIHGMWDEYERIIEIHSLTESVQVGDFGIGMPRETEDLIAARDRVWQEGNHRFIRGNHDNPFQCSYHKPFISDGTHEDGVYYVGGASSVDRGDRVEGKNWWYEEELTHSDFYVLMDQYENVKPDMIVSHECPDEIARKLFPWYKEFEAPSRTRQALSSMHYIHKPKVHIFGHWHESRDVVIDGCRFICLGINEIKEVKL